MTAARHVRRLRLEGADDTALTRGRILVEDALRTASLPGAEGGRLYVVRRLELGVIDPARPPVVLARAIEARFALLRASAVHAGAPNAPLSPAVYFHDAIEVFTLLVGRIVNGPTPQEWFWPLVARAHSRRQTRSEALRGALAGALSTPGRLAAVASLMAALSDGEIDEICAAVRPIDVESMLPGLRREAADRSALDAPPRSLSPRWSSVLRRWSARWVREDPRITWLAAMAICAATPARAAGPGLARAAARTVASLLSIEESEDPVVEGGNGGETAGAGEGRKRDPIDTTTSRVGTGTIMVTVDRSPPSEGPPAPNAAEESVAAVRDPVHAPSRARRGPAPDQTVAAESACRPTVKRDRSAPAWQGLTLATAAGGLLFVLRPLGRLGIAHWLDTQPAAVEAGFACHLLRFIGGRVGIPEDDPGFAPWEVPPDQTLSARHRRALTSWHGRLSRWTRRHTRLTLRTMICRPAGVVATRMHVDVVFNLRDADANVRAAGLDLDPGWVPWLGRIVQFHYTEAA